MMETAPLKRPIKRSVIDMKFEISDEKNQVIFLGEEFSTSKKSIMGDRFLSSAGTGGNCVRSMRLPDPSPVLDKNCAPMGPEILSSTGAGVWRKASMAFPDSSSDPDKFLFATLEAFQGEYQGNFGEFFGNFVSNLTSLFGNFVHRSAALTVWFTRL